MTPDELDALLERATPGPWRMVGTSWVQRDGDHVVAAARGTLPQRQHDLEAVAALRNLAPLLVDLWRADMLDNRYARSKARTAALRALAGHSVEGTP